MRVAVFGASSPTGRRVVERAIASGHEVTAFVRDPSRLGARHERLSVVGGDARDAEAVGRAVSGVDGVISLLGGEPSNPLTPRRAPSGDGPASAGVANIVAAVGDEAPVRLIYVSAWGVGDGNDGVDLGGAFFIRAVVPPLLRDDYADKEAAEAMVMESGLKWVIVRPMLLTNGPWSNDYRIGEGLSPGRKPWISRADVADFLLRAVAGDDSFLYHTPAIGY